MLYRQEIMPYKRIKRQEHKTVTKKNSIVSSKLLVIYGMSFLISRFFIMGALGPFGISIFVAAENVLSTEAAIITGIFAVCGYWSTLNVQMMVGRSATVIVLMLITIFAKGNRKNRILKLSSIAMVLDVTISLSVQYFVHGMTQYFIVLTVLEGILAMAASFVFAFGIPVYFENLKHKGMNQEEMVCLGFLLASAVAGTNNLSLQGFSISDVIVYYIIIFSGFTFGPGVGAAWGIILGSFSGIGMSGSLMGIGSLGLIGLVGGLFKSLGKLLSSAAFVLACLITNIYAGDVHSGLFKLLSMGIAILLFLITPKSLFQKFKLATEENKEPLEGGITHIEKVNDLMDRKLTALSSTLKGLSEVLSKNVDNELSYNTEINGMVERLADRVCTNCDCVNACWKKDFLFTFDSFTILLRNIEKLGGISFDDVPKQLKNRCIRPNELIKQSAYLYEIFKLNNKWRKKLINSKIIVSEQMKGITEIMKSMTDEISSTIEFKSDMEKSLAIAFDRSGLEFEDILAIKNGKGRYEVTVYKKPCQGDQRCRKDFGTVISRTLGVRMARESGKCRISSDCLTCQFRYVEAESYNVITGVSRAAKEEVSGDNYSYGEIGSGRYLLALSDGMGSGTRAAIESNTTISLLEKFMEAGYDRNTAIKAINSVLVLRSNDESFATIDMGLIDLYTGLGEFIKIGSSPTYIKSGMEVEQLSSTSIPVGILDDVEIESQIIPLKNGDMIVMVTDGVVDADKENNEKWILKTLKELNSGNPKDVSEYLINKAKDYYGDKIGDDMTVMVSKIWKVI